MPFDNSMRSLQQMCASVFGRREVTQQPGQVRASGHQLQSLSPPSRLALTVNAQGQVDVGERTPDGRLARDQQLLSEILNKPNQSFKLNERGQLADPQGFEVRANSTAHMVYAFVSSRPSRPGSDASLEKSFSKAHLGQKSDVFESAGGKGWTLHDKQLYQFGDDNGWSVAGLPERHNGKFKSLSFVGHDLCALDEAGSAWKLGDHQPIRLPFASPISALAAQEGRYMALLAHDARFYLTEAENDGRSIELTVSGGQLGSNKADKPLAIGFAGSSVLMVDGGGRLHIGSLPMNSEWPQELNFKPHIARRLGDEHFGKLTFSGLFNDEAGDLHARFKDGHGKEHTAHWDKNRGELVPGWNLSQSVAVVRQQNLPTLVPDIHDVIHLDGGSVAQKSGQLLVNDPLVEAWSKGAESNLQDLHQGNDGFAYIVDKQGAVKRLAVHAQGLSRAFGSGPELSAGHGIEVKAGATLRGAHDVVAEKIAVLNDDRYVTLSDGHLRTHDQRGTRQNLPPLPGFGDAETLSIPDPHEVDHRHIQDMTIAGGDLYVLKAGALFRMAAQHWQAGKRGLGVHHLDQSAWILVEPKLPAGAEMQSIRTSPDGALLVRHGDTEQQLSADGSLTAASIQNPKVTRQHDLHQRLATREHALGGSTRHGNAKVSVSVLGRANMETVTPREANTGPLNYLASHLRVASGLRKPFDKATHVIKGRKGLADVYQAESEMLARLEERRRLTPSDPVQAITASLGQIRNNFAFVSNPKADLLTDVIEQATHAIAEDTERLLRSLAQDHDVIKGDGKENPDYRPAKPLANDMIAALAHSLKISGVTGTSLNGLLDQLTTQQFRIGYRNPLGGRERSDSHALVKARLALNADVLFELSGQLGLLAKAAGAANNTSNSLLDGVADSLELIYAQQYVDAPLKKYTDAGFRSHQELEASYDASKTMLKYFRDSKHPMTQNLRVGLNVPSERVIEEFSTALRQLKPRENLKISRNYAGNISGGVSGPVAAPAYLGGRANIEPERTYGLTFTRYERGLKVSINRDGAVGGGANLGFGAGYADHPAPKNSTTDNLRQNSSWMGVSADLKYKYTQTSAMSFFVRDEDIEGFVRDLTTKPLQKSDTSERDLVDRLHPLAFLSDSTEQEVRTGSKHNVDMDFNAGAEYRFNDGQIGAQPVRGFMRLSIGAVGTANLASYERERVNGRGSDGLRTDIRSDNRMRFLEKGGATAYARLFDSVFSAQRNNVFLSGGVPTGVSASIILENKTGKVFDVRFKDTLPLLPSDTKALSSALEKAFPLIDAPDLTGQDVNQQLETLYSTYAGAAHASDEQWTNAQYSALNSLGQARRQNKAAAQNIRLMSTMDLITRQSNVRRVNHASTSKRGADTLRGLLDLKTNPGNAEKIAALMRQDPQLAGLIKELQGSEGTTRAEIKLEVTDDAKATIDKHAIDGTLSDRALKAILGDEHNLRIKSISVFRNAAKEDSFTLPGLWMSYRSGSNLSVERLRGEITFDYAQAPQIPVGYKLEGQLTTERDTSALKDMAAQGAGSYRLK